MLNLTGKKLEVSTCQNCGEVYRDDELNEVEDIEERVGPGEEMPSGECPDEECRAVCHPYVPDAKELAAALEGLLEQVFQMKGMFSDEDGNIADSILDAQRALGLPESER
jgi:hypothetical protein